VRHNPLPVEGADLLGTPVGLELEQVERVHRMGDVAVVALRRVSLRIAPGEFVALVGPSGCGKSTLLSLIGGLDRPTQGSVSASGLRLQDVSDAVLSDYRLRRVGTVFQAFNLIPTLSAQDNVSLPMALAGVPRTVRRSRAQALLDLVGVGARARHRPSRLSGGEQQRVAVARALANRPGLLLADEPTGNLDSESGGLVLDLLQEVHDLGATVVLVSHDPSVAARADRVVTMRDGRIIHDPGRPVPLKEESPASKPSRLRLLEAVRLGAGSIRRRKLRTGLTASGISIGIAAMALILSLATGLQNVLVDQLQQSGQLQNVSIQHNFSEPTRDKSLNQVALDSLRGLPHVKDAYGEVALQGSLEGGSSSIQATTLLSSAPLRQTTPISSRFLSAGRLSSSDTAPEAVLGADAASKLGWNPRQALGKSVTFRGVYSGSFIVPGSGVQPAGDQQPLRLTVVGIGGGSPGSPTPVVAVPYQTAVRYWEQMADANGWRADKYGSITLVADAPGTVDKVRDEAKAEGYQAQSSQDLIKQVSQLLFYLGLGLSAFAAIALAVAALGIANTMYTAVLERTREIGILKALGARRSDVRIVFLAEAAAIGALGGAIGVGIAEVVALAGNAVVNQLARQQGIGLDLNVFQLNLLLALATIVLTALFSALCGLLPAVRAARLAPVEALRYE
jgi:ABC-type lipoprotein export system ATPase subunit/ABC-type antimicrobial peptide transport system permease subunit